MYKVGQYLLLKEDYAEEQDMFNIVRFLNNPDCYLANHIDCLVNEGDSPAWCYIPEEGIARVLLEDELEIVKVLFSKEYKVISRDAYVVYKKSNN